MTCLKDIYLPVVVCSWFLHDLRTVLTVAGIAGRCSRSTRYMLNTAAADCPDDRIDLPETTGPVVKADRYSVQPYPAVPEVSVANMIAGMVVGTAAAGTVLVVLS